jgi:radical SAM superfamily enzyme YgiQ (UPF0313 family)
VKEIVLTTINAKWIHPSLALRLLKANLGSLEEKCEIIEFNLRQPLGEKVETLLVAQLRILGISISIWNHTATLELLAELERAWMAHNAPRPIIVLGGPEVTYLPEGAEIFRFADFVIRGEGETAFKMLCENVLAEAAHEAALPRRKPEFINAEPVSLEKIKSAYHLYTDEDLAKKLIYVESSRGCPFKCEFCLSSLDSDVREFPLDPFLAQMDELVGRGAGTFKFLDRTFNVNIKRALKIIEFFLKKIGERKERLVVHFEMVPSIFPDELREALSRFPPESLRLEIGIQSLNREVCARIGRLCDPEKELETLRFLREKTNAIIHADLIAGLPGEDLASFGRGFDRLWQALNSAELYNAALYSSVLCSTALAAGEKAPAPQNRRAEIQLGILKLLPSTPSSRHNDTFKMRYKPLPPYEVEETAAIGAVDLCRIGNFARFWELIVNRGLVNFAPEEPVFDKFMALSDLLFAHFGRNWGIARDELLEILKKEVSPFKFPVKYG